MGVIPNPKMAFIFPILCIFVLIFPIFMIYFPKCEEKGSFPKSLIKSRQSQFQRFLFQTLCVFSQMKDTKHIRRVFYSVAWVMPLGWDLGVLRGKIKFRPAVCPLCYLLLNHWTKLNQIWCVSYSHEWGVQRKKKFGLAPRGPWEGPKGQISFNFNYKVNFKDFCSKLCVCSHK